MTITSKIKEIVSVKERQGDKWTVYYFIVEMENGDKYPIKKGKMKKDWFTVGQELNYEIKKDWEYDKIYVEEEKKEFGKTFTPKNYKADAVSFSISYAKDLVIAGKATDLEKEADKIYMRMLSKFNSLNV